MNEVFFYFCCCFLLSITLRPINAQYARCQNPNKRSGVCVSVYDCQTVLSVLQRKPLEQRDVEFVRASQCYDGYTAANDYKVCCTADTGYKNGQPKQVQQQQYFSRQQQPDFGDNQFYWESPQRTVLRPVNNNQFSFQEERSNNEQYYNPNNADLLPQPPSCGGVTIGSKIYGGADADLNEFPWVVLLEYNRRSNNALSTNCAGTLINQRYVLTAAHCTTGEIEKRIGTLTGVRLGEHDTTRQVDCNQFTCAPESLRAGIEEIITHERYKPRASNQEYDIALLRLDYTIRYSNSIRPICLPSVVGTYDPQPGTKLTVAGWGRTLVAARSPVKRKVNVAVVDLNKCASKFSERKVQIVESQICAGAQYGEDSCDGDSGGPLMVFRNGAWVLEGIVSFGYKCGLRGWPGVYTRVAFYDDWVKSKIRA